MLSPEKKRSMLKEQKWRKKKKGVGMNKSRWVGTRRNCDQLFANSAPNSIFHMLPHES